MKDTTHWNSMMLRILLVVGLPVMALCAAPPRTFGKGVPNFPVTASEERELATFTLGEGAAMGSITHFWSTACGGNTPAWDGPDAGSTIYRFYVDGESTASIEAQPRMMTGFGFWPAPAPAPTPAPAAARWSKLQNAYAEAPRTAQAPPRGCPIGSPAPRAARECCSAPPARFSPRSRASNKARLACARTRRGDAQSSSRSIAARKFFAASHS